MFAKIIINYPQIPRVFKSLLRALADVNSHLPSPQLVTLAKQLLVRGCTYPMGECVIGWCESLWVYFAYGVSE